MVQASLSKFCSSGPVVVCEFASGVAGRYGYVCDAVLHTSFCNAARAANFASCDRYRRMKNDKVMEGV